MKKIIIVTLLVSLLMTSCSLKSPIKTTNTEKPNNIVDFQLDTNSFSLIIESNIGEQIVSLPQTAKTVSDYSEKKNGATWNYPEEGINVDLSRYSEYIDITINYEKEIEDDFEWPQIKGKNYTFPLGEGKTFSYDDQVWLEYLSGQTLSTLESLSMAFFAVGDGDNALLYIMTDNYNNNLIFSDEETLGLTLSHTFPSINEHKSYNLRIYSVKDNPLSIAKTYKNYVEENQGITSLKEKEKVNPNIAKLYGAPHIYLFDDFVISENDIDWEALWDNLNSIPMLWIKELAEKSNGDLPNFFSSATYFEPERYDKITFIRTLSTLLAMPEFYNPDVFPTYTSPTNQMEMIQRNKKALHDAMLGVFKPIDTWANDRTIDLLNSLYDAGIQNAWIGLNSWEQAFSKPELAMLIQNIGWLVAPYDSYHSIHQPGEEQWITAAFSEANAYEDLTIVNKQGEYISGFQGIGRKLNPTLAFPLVENRVNTLLSNGNLFNSWFVDCDATGEVYSDYSLNHSTTMKQDVTARLNRMDWLNTEKNLIVGSEGGNDYAANTIAFAHGIELPAFSWMDEDMTSNKESEYYLGRYYAPNGSVPEKMSKQIPIKDKFKDIFLNPIYNVPLYKLVYNNVIITSYHWEWPTLKIQDEVENRQLYEMLYNVPPMYHIDKFELDKNGEQIINHIREWSDWSKNIIHEEMNDFQILTDDKTIQLATYGNKNIIVNYSDSTYIYEGTTIEAKSYAIF